MRDINNTELQTRLKALVDLQSVLRSQHLGPEALHAVSNKIRELQMSQKPQAQAPMPLPIQNQSSNPVPSSATTYPHPIPYGTPIHAPYAPPPQSVPPQPTFELPSTQPPSTATLAGLLASYQRNQHSAPPGRTHSEQNGALPQPQPAAAAPSTSAEIPLLAQLRAAGLLAVNSSKEIDTPASQVINNQTAKTNTPSLNLSDLLRQVATKPSGPSRSDRIELNSMSLKL